MGHTGIARECFAQRGNRTRSPHFKRELSGGSMSQLRELHSQKKELIEEFEKEFKEYIRTVEDVISI